MKLCEWVRVSVSVYYTRTYKRTHPFCCCCCTSRVCFLNETGNDDGNTLMFNVQRMLYASFVESIVPLPHAASHCKIRIIQIRLWIIMFCTERWQRICYSFDPICCSANNFHFPYFIRTRTIYEWKNRVKMKMRICLNCQLAMNGSFSISSLRKLKPKMLFRLWSLFKNLFVDDEQEREILSKCYLCVGSSHFRFFPFLVFVFFVLFSV